MKSVNRPQNALGIILICAISFTFQSCANYSGQSGSSVASPSVLSATTTATTYTVTNVSVSQPTGSQYPQLSLSVGSSATPLTNYCGTTAALACACQLTWAQATTSGNTPTTYTRVKTIPTASVQTALVNCNLDGSWGEIPASTVITMNIIAMPGNSSGLTVTAVNYSKGTTTDGNGDFLDAQLTPFRNIKRYSCWSKHTVAQQVFNDTTTAQIQTNPNDPNSPTTNILYPWSSKFCTGSSGNQCPTVATVNSSESFYRNLYIQSNLTNNISSQNDSFDCPLVEEPLGYSSPASQVPSGVKGTQYWPFDTQFALATEQTATWTVPIRGDSVLTNSNNTQVQPSFCGSTDPEATGASTPPNDNAGITRTCLGFAAKPKTDGTCGTFTDSTGLVRPLTRLRRYRVLYPPFFDITGNVPASAPYNIRWMDEVLVADRLEINSLGQLTGNAIAGPKPCEFQWFDQTGTTDPTLASNSFNTSVVTSTGYGQPVYQATSQYYRHDGSTGYASWVSPDGWRYPNYDMFGTLNGTPQMSCSATLPIVERIGGSPSSVILVTTNLERTDSLNLNGAVFPLNEVRIRPIEPWVPQYVEDTTFQACVPNADPFQDPPIYGYRDSANTYSWCAKVYPTKNPNWIELNSKIETTGNTLETMVVNYPNSGGETVKHYTQNDAGFIGATPSCLPTTVCDLTVGQSEPSELANCKQFLGEPVSWTPQCDRTVVYSSFRTYRTFPIQADDLEIKSNLANDMTNGTGQYGCTYTLNSDQTKIGTKSPSTGCCMHGYFDSLGVGVGGHLEPIPSTIVPNQLFCGNPVQ